MLELLQPKQSSLFVRVVQRKDLPHPTSRKFSEAVWVEALRDLEGPEDRDVQIASAAVHYGRELARLRNAFDEKIFKSLGARDAKIFSVAFANREYFVLAKKTRDQASQRNKNGVARLDGLQQILIKDKRMGNDAAPDSMAATIVDTLPHCLERAEQLSTDRVDDDYKFDSDNLKLYTVLSIEHSIRDLWQQVLWEGAFLRVQEDAYRQEPANKALAEYWIAWNRRLESVASQGAMVDALANRRNRALGQATKPYLDKTVVAIGTGKGGRSFRFGPQAGSAGQQGHHTGEITILEDSYLADYLDVPLPAFGKHSISCRDLHRIWCVLFDAAEVLRSKIKSRDLRDAASAQQFSLLIRTLELERAAKECALVSSEVASDAVKFLTLTSDDTSAMFADGFWSRPILSLDENDSVLIHASIATGSPLRRMEHWLARGGLADHLADSRRGLNYESYVRGELVKALSKNKLLPNSYCAPEGLKSAGGEQIDLIFRIGGLIVVAEIKCFLSPIESVERFNYLKNLDGACIQAKRKADWARKNSEIVAKALALTKDEVEGARIVPLVVLNQGVGAAFIGHEARIIDFHFLELYLADGKYVAGAAFRPLEGDTVFQHEILYENEKEAEDRFVDSMENPKTLKKFLDVIKWIETSFPMSDGRKLIIENCVMGGNLMPIADDEIMNLFPA